MRILFSGTPFAGHLLPMAPLIRAAVAAGDEVAILASVDLKGFLHREIAPELTVLAAGPSAAETMAAMQARTGVSPASRPEPGVIAAFFAGERVDAAIEDARRSVDRWGPDVVISETLDVVGALVAHAADVPHFRHTYGPTRPPVLMEALLSIASAQARIHGLGIPVPEAWIDVYPEVLEPVIGRPGPRLPLRPEPHSRPYGATTTPSTPDTSTVLVSFGTVFDGPALRADVLRSLDGVQADVIATTAATGNAAAASIGVTTDRRRVVVPFVPLAELLPNIDVVVTAGGAGTVLGAMAAGVPLVILPLGADHEGNAAPAVAAGCALVVRSADQVGEAVARILADPAFGDRAREVGAAIAAMPPAAAVLEQVRHAVGHRVRTRPTCRALSRPE